jgi:ribA/ribD-fused uncharacterized protein
VITHILLNRQGRQVRQERQGKQFQRVCLGDLGDLGVLGGSLFLTVLLAGCAAHQDAVATAAPATTRLAVVATRPAAVDSSKIGQFQGQYRFLSNFYPAVVEFEGITYPSVEHAYQSGKTLDMNERRRIAAIKEPAEAKRAGRALNPQRPDWEQVKFEVMETCIRYKFTHDPLLRDKLLATGDATLEEGNTWGDRIWGTVDGVGENRLGKILMKVRGELRRETR